MTRSRLAHPFETPLRLRLTAPQDRRLKGPVAAVFLLLALLVFAAPAQADVFSLGRYDFARGEEAGAYVLTASLPETAASAAAVGWPDGCRETSHDRQSTAGRAHYVFEIRCGRPIARGDVIRTPWLVDGAAFTSSATGQSVERALTAGDDGVVLPVGDTVVTRRSFSEVAGGL